MSYVFLASKNEDVIWYGFAFNEDDYSALKEELYSFIGFLFKIIYVR